MMLPREAKVDTIATALPTEPKSDTLKKPIVALHATQLCFPQQTTIDLRKEHSRLVQKIGQLIIGTCKYSGRLTMRRKSEYS